VFGALAWAWNTQLCDTVVRDSLPKSQFAALLTQSGIDNMDGGREKWVAEGRDLETMSRKATPSMRPYQTSGPDYSIRAFHEQELGAVGKSSKTIMIDVRSPQEFSGEILAPPGLPETCQYGGHLPARTAPRGARPAMTTGRSSRSTIFRSCTAPRREPVNAGECLLPIGERSSHTWFVLKYLLSVGNALTYDGSWTEWGNLVGAPVERGCCEIGEPRDEAAKL
jgi:thiosulfate/3-mercaptopyruvate sulfurtransferase